jgi:hypothetical protein
MPERERPSIGADVVEAAGEAIVAAEEAEHDPMSTFAIEAAIRAADKARGLHEEREELHQAPDGTMLYRRRLASGWTPEAERITHGRHCVCSACAAQDWAEPGLAPCGMHGPSCPPVYAPLGAPGNVVCGPNASVRVDTEPSEPNRIANDLCGDAFNVLRDLVEAHDGWSVNCYPADNGSRRSAEAWFAEAKAVENVVERARTLIEIGPSATSEGESRG